MRDPYVSGRALGKRLAAIDGSKAESKRHWIGKILKGKVEQPNEQSVRELEEALGKPGYFTRCEPAPSRASRLQELEDTVWQLKAVLERMSAVLEELGARVVALEDQAGGTQAQEGP